MAIYSLILSTLYKFDAMLVEVVPVSVIRTLGFLLRGNSLDMLLLSSSCI